MTLQEIRTTILDALDDVGASEVLDPALLESFASCRADILLRDLGLNSMDRMELLVALELEHNVVITPREYSRFESLGGIASHVDKAAPLDAALVSEKDSSEGAGRGDEPKEPWPPVVRLFRRVFRGCRAVGQLHKVFTTLESRLTPLELRTLVDWNSRGWLLPTGAHEKYADALSGWLRNLQGMLNSSGKLEPEPYQSTRIAPAAVLFAGPGDRSAKTLLVCFATRGSRTLFMPNPVLLQHTDAGRYDLLVLFDPWGTAHRAGVPHMGGNVSEVVEWIAGLDLLGDYGRLRTMGCSGGGYPAMLTGRRVQAELAVSICGRFPSERYLGEVLAMLFKSWVSYRRNKRMPVLLAYGETKRRDRAYARRLARITGADQLVVQMPKGKLGHNVIEPLIERRQLAGFLDQTLFTPSPADPKVSRGQSAPKVFRIA